MRLLWLPEVLRAAGLTVHEVPGWRERGSPQWGPDTTNPAYRMPLQGVVWHATAGARNGSTQGEIDVLIRGSTTAPPPIAQLYLARDGDWHVVASGRCNHVLVGWAGPLDGLGNYQLVGVEAGNDNRGELWPKAQLDSYHVGTAALLRRLGLPASRVAGHKEHQPYPPPPGTTSTKSDPHGIDMPAARTRVAALLTEADMPISDDDAELIAQAVWNRAQPTVSRAAGRDVVYGEMARLVYGQRLAARDAGNAVLVEVEALRGQVAGLTELLGHLATMPGVPITPEQLTALTTAVAAAARAPGDRLLEALAAAGEVAAGGQSAEG